jgi:tetratricopeptide (TPR) repeat protein
VWTSYSARAAAQVVGLPESAVRALARAGVVGEGGDAPLRLAFRDLAALRTIKALLDRGLSLRRALREAIALHRRLPPGRTLAEVALELRDGQVVIRGEVAPTPQLALPLEPPPPPPAGELRAIPVRREAAALEPVPPPTAEAWFERALALEDGDGATAAAIDAYRRGLRLRPEATEAWINLGRLHAEDGDGPAARECFERALALDPADATALYNLGVVAQDAGLEAEAIALYVRALALDPALAEAHYNLATIFDQRGEAQQAIRHINEYRKLTR